VNINEIPIQNSNYDHDEKKSKSIAAKILFSINLAASLVKSSL